MQDDVAAELFAIVFVIAIWVTPILLGIRSALRKGISPHWMWFGVHPLGGWIAFIVIACKSPRAHCVRCGLPQPPGARFCARCGFDAYSAWAPPANPATPVSQGPPFAPSASPLVGGQSPVAASPPQWAGAPAQMAGPPPAAPPFAPPGVRWVQAPPRPTIVTVLGVIGLIAGIAGVLGTPFAIVQLSGDWRTSSDLWQMYENPVYRGWMIVSLPLGLGASVFWIFTGTGLLRLQRWAHSAAVWLLVYHIAMGVIGLVVTVVAFFVLPSSDTMGYPSAMGEGVIIASLGLVGGVIGIALAGVALHFLRQPSVERAFRTPTHQGAG